MNTKTPNTKELALQKLRSTSWFQNSTPDIQNQLLHLPDDHLGFLTDIANRPTELSHTEITKLIELKQGKQILIPIFEVRSLDTNQIFTYEYAASKYGGKTRFRGILLIEQQGQITHLILAKTEKFPLGRFTYDTIGGFIEYQHNQLKNMPKNIEESIKKSLGITDIHVTRFFDLGTITPDSSMTDKEAAIFAAVIDGASAKNIQSLSDKTLYTHKLGYEIEIIPLNQIRQYIFSVADSHFLAILLRLHSMGIINLG